MHPKDIPHASEKEILTSILDVVTAIKNGHFTTHMPEGFPGIGGQIAQVINAHLEMLQTFRAEHHRLMEEIGITGRLGGVMDVPEAAGAWKAMVQETTQMAGNVTGQFRDGANVTRELLRGNLDQRITCPYIQGEFREFREEFNQLAERFEQNSSVESEPVAG